MQVSVTGATGWVGGSIGSSSLISASSQVSQDLVKAALSGAGDSDLVALLGAALTATGLDISTIEVACDAVDPERAQHFIRWRRNVEDTESKRSLPSRFSRTC